MPQQRHSRSYGNDERRRLAVKWAISYQRNLRGRALAALFQRKRPDLEGYCVLCRYVGAGERLAIDGGRHLLECTKLPVEIGDVREPGA